MCLLPRSILSSPLPTHPFQPTQNLPRSTPQKAPLLIYLPWWCIPQSTPMQLCCCCFLVAAQIGSAVLCCALHCRAFYDPWALSCFPILRDRIEPKSHFTLYVFLFLSYCLPFSFLHNYTLCTSLVSPCSHSFSSLPFFVHDVFLNFFIIFFWGGEEKKTRVEISKAFLS